MTSIPARPLSPDPDVVRNAVADGLRALSAASRRASLDAENVPSDGLSIFAAASNRVRELNNEIRGYMTGINERTAQAAQIRDDIGVLQEAIAQHPMRDSSGNPVTDEHAGIDLNAAVLDADGQRIYNLDGTVMTVRDQLVAAGYNPPPIPDGTIHGTGGVAWEKPQVDAALQHKKTLLENVNSGNEMDMIHLNNIISARSQAIQMASNIMSKMDKTLDAIAQNMGR